MEIRTLKDLKEALNNVPNEVLEHFGVSETDDDIGLADFDWEEDTQIAYKHFEEAQKHEAFGLVEKYFEALRDAYRNEDFEEDVSVKL
jgi:phosphoglycolate phosphatase-like HAD superfamily hydrolase